MTGLLAALLLSATTPADPLGARIATSAQAAEALQGPLDGAWALRDAKGRKLLILQIIDPAAGGVLAAAWRTPGDGGATGYVDTIERTGDKLTLHIDPTANLTTADVVVRVAGRGFAGESTAHGRRQAVRLTREP